MRLGELLVQEKIVPAEAIDQALDRQRNRGGTLGDNLVALGLLTTDQLNAVFRRRPPAPTSIGETELDPSFLLALMLKSMYVYGYESIPQIAGELRLRMGIIKELLELAAQRGFIEALVQNNPTAGSGDLRYVLTTAGKQRANEALELSQYVGPAPVTLAAFQTQVERQRISHERIGRDRLVKALGRLILPDTLIDDLGPAVNSGRVIFFYGPPGNGKTSIATSLANAFENLVYIPHAVMIDGQIIRIFDPSIHTPVNNHAGGDDDGTRSLLRRDQFDPRWVCCSRPIVVTGGELTLQMLDLTYNREVKFYDAPLQLKAAGGILIVDDFGYQNSRATDLLSRWVAPLERKIDYLTLQTGKKYPFPFDLLLVFSTNIPVDRLLDQGMMRRLPFKVAVTPPTREEFARIFRQACRSEGIDDADAILPFLFADCYERYGRQLAAYHPSFIVDYIVARSRYEGRLPSLEHDLVMKAVENLYVRE